MTEKEVIRKIKELQQIKPRKDWVILTKAKILSEPLISEKQASVTIGERFLEAFSIFRFRPFLKPALATAVCFCFLIGVFSFAQNALPGDLLYSVKKISEQAKVSLASETEKPKVQLELTQKKLDELTKIAEENRGKNLASAVQEVEKVMRETAESLKKVAIVENDGEIAKEIKEKVEAIEKQKETVEEILATKIDSEEYDESINSYYKTLVEREIKELEDRALNSEQEELLKEAKELFDDENYQEALAKILFLSY
ncbi:hypothetical protein KAU51_02470 [Candidatus Parcubacteria bacterium]|nr:hypothetical protein [Candidatus Parcubacteria bacterium]